MRQEFNEEEYTTFIGEHITEATISEALSNNAAHLAYYGTQEAEWFSRESISKLILEEVCAEKRIELKEEFKGEKLTAAELDARVTIDADVKKSARVLEVAKRQHQLYKNASKAIVERGNRLGNLNSRNRSEMSMSNGVHVETTQRSNISPSDAKEIARRAGNSRTND